jgi:hypothetical protein
LTKTDTLAGGCCAPVASISTQKLGSEPFSAFGFEFEMIEVRQQIGFYVAVTLKAGGLVWPVISVDALEDRARCSRVLQSLATTAQKTMMAASQDE